MKQLLLSAFLALAFLVAPFHAKAQESTTIAVVDVRSLMSESDAAKNIQKQVTKLRDKFQAEYTKVEKELREKQKKLAEEHAESSQEEFAKKRQAFEAEFIAARNRLQKSKRDLDEAVTEAMNELQTHILNIVAKESEAKGYTLVLSRQNVVIASNDIDITPDVLKQLNDTVKKIDVELEKE